MTLPEMQVTDEMRRVAEEVVMAHYQVEQDGHDQNTLRYDAAQNLLQVSLDANPEYSAFGARDTETDRGIRAIEDIRLEEEALQKAKEAFDVAVGNVVQEAIRALQESGRLPETFSSINVDSHYGNGHPPHRIPEEVHERGHPTYYTDLVIIQTWCVVSVVNRL